jgi:hypothetical protein
MCLKMVIFNWSTQNMRVGLRRCRPIIPHYTGYDLVHADGFVKGDVSLFHLQYCSVYREYEANKVDELLDGSLSLM